MASIWATSIALPRVIEVHGPNEASDRDHESFLGWDRKMKTKYGRRELTSRTAKVAWPSSIRSATQRVRSFCLSLCCVTVAFVANSVSAQDGDGSHARPNVLMIAIDDLNDWLGCMGGHPQAMSPHIDQLAHRGTLFTNAHCQGPICGPSRASLLSGRYPHSTGVYQQPSGKGLEEDREFFAGHLLPEYFADHGYRTLGCGKITHGYSAKKAFQEFGGTFGGFGPKPKARVHYHLPDVPWTGTLTDWGAFPDVDEKMPDHQVADWATDKLRQTYDRPFFLAVGFVRPHVPFYVPGKWFEPFDAATISLPEVKEDDLSDVPDVGRRMHAMPKYPNLRFLRANDDRQFRLAVQAYLSCIRFVDHQVGRVLAALDESEYADNTVVVLWSDHGYHLGEKDRVSKHSLWEESTRVPLIIYDPRNHTAENAGLRCDQPVGLIDLYPTLLQLCDLPPKASNEGKSLVGLVHSPESESRSPVLTTYARDNHSLRGSHLRYIRYEDGTEELYDHRDDPQEWTNLAQDPSYSKQLSMMRARLPSDSAPYHPTTSPKPVNEWFAEHLRRNHVTD